MTKNSTFCVFFQPLGSIRQMCSHCTEFCVNLPALHPQLVDLGFSNVSPLLSLLQLVLDLAKFRKISIGLFLLRIEIKIWELDFMVLIALVTKQDYFFNSNISFLWSVCHIWLQIWTKLVTSITFFYFEEWEKKPFHNGRDNLIVSKPYMWNPFMTYGLGGKEEETQIPSFTEFSKQM